MTWLFRRTVRTPFLVKAAVLAAAATAMACGLSAESASFADRDPSAGAPDPDYPAGGSLPGIAPGEAGRSAPLVSPLCGTLTCDPDLENACVSYVGVDAGAGYDAGSGSDAGAAQDAGTPPGDAAAGDAGRGADGCRVTKGTNDEPVTACQPAGRGRDGMPCERSKDCAAGFECSSEGVCRRYCCDNKCDGVTLNGPGAFCDVQQTRDVTKIKVPLCMPLRPCELFSVGECKDTEFCSVVAPGKSGCIARGSAVAGESCESAHCERDLACLGQLGSRTCKKLCRENGFDCPPDKICKPSSTIPRGFGVCDAP
jgi:hypothetical protein